MKSPYPFYGFGPVTGHCPHCDDTRWVKADPDMVKVRKLYGSDATAASAQLTVRRCACKLTKQDGPSTDDDQLTKKRKAKRAGYRWRMTYDG